MALCDFDPEAIVLYSPDDEFETVRFSRNVVPTKETFEIDHYKMAEIICMQGGGYSASLDRFESVVSGQSLRLVASVHDTYAIYNLLPEDADRVQQNNQAALTAWDSLCAAGNGRGAEGARKVETSKRHKDESCWKRIQVSINLLTQRLKELDELKEAD